MSINQFHITGRVGHIHKGNKFMRITVYIRTYKKDIKDTRISITVFSEKSRNFIESYITCGDIVSASGHIQSGSYEREGKKIYTTDLIARNFSLEARAKSKKAA